jgi:hypothetical protein
MNTNYIFLFEVKIGNRMMAQNYEVMFINFRHGKSTLAEIMHRNTSVYCTLILIGST